MRKRSISVSLFIAAAFMFTACDNSSSNKKSEGEAIVMGDPSTIITEKDSAHLRDMVADLKPEELALPIDSVPPKKADTVKAAGTVAEKTADKAPAQNVSGLSIAFKEVTILVPGVTAKLAGKTNLEKANSATYQLTDGKINGNGIQVSGGTITNVSMRYQSEVSIKNNLGTLELDALGSTSGWKTIKGNNGSYNITGLNDNQLATAKITPGAIKNAVSKKARQRRMNRKTEQQWQASVRNVRSANQKPMDVSLRAVMFKIDGKDKAGKSFSKQVRIDL
jgi:hypothetical protein